MSTPRFRIGVVLLLLVVGCGPGGQVDPTGSGGEGTQVRMDFLRSAGFYSAPFPSEDLRRANGSIDLAGFPNPEQIPFVKQVLDVLNKAGPGFGLSSAGFFSLTGPVEPELLPDIYESVRDDTPVFLMGVDTDSPDYLAKYPVDVAFSEDGGPFGSANLLSLLPLQGIPLRPLTAYAAVVLRDLRDREGNELAVPANLSRLLSGQRPAGMGGEAHAGYLSALAALREAGVDPARLAGLAVFITGDPVSELGLFREDVLSRPLPRPSRPFVRNEVFPDYCVYETTIPMPVYQSGKPPFLFSGGGWVVDDAGRPQLQTEEEANFVLTVPRAAMPAKGFPVLIFSRTGAGGERPLVDRVRRNKQGEPDDEPGSGPAKYLAQAGFAAVSVDGPHGGLRNVTGGDEQFLVFNILNPLAMRDNVRQSALEMILMAHVVERIRLRADDCPGVSTRLGRPVSMDVSRMAIMGHSMGATILQPALLSEPRFRAAIMSGAGGSYIENLVYKESPLRVKPLAEMILHYRRMGRELNEHDPVASLVQWAGEPADPPVYNALLRERPEGIPHILMLQGIVDTYILPPMANASSLSLGLDLAGQGLDAENTELARFRPLEDLLTFSGRRRIDLPASGNIVGRDGSPGTAVVVQHPEDGIEDGHEVAFQTDVPKIQYRCFLESFSKGLPRVPAGGPIEATCE